MDEQSGLGRGLGSLIPKAHAGSDALPGERILKVSAQEIDSNPHQPRQAFEHAGLEDLINSIKEHGILQPLVVSRLPNGRYELIAGERRLRAAKVLGLAEVPVVVREASDQQKLELALVENVQRKDLNPIERAVGYQKLADQFGLTQEQVAKKVGQSRSAVANTLRLLSLPEPIRQALREGRLSEGHGKVLLSVPDEKRQLEMAKKILLHNLTVRQVESQVGPSRRSRKSQTGDPEFAEFEQAITEALGTKVRLTGKRKGGKITIEFYSEEELEGIVKKIKGKG